MPSVISSRCVLAGLLLIGATSLGGCSTAYYKTMELFGQEKRDILVDRVEDGREAQHDAKEQFRTALEKFTAVTGFKGGKLQTKYNELKSAFDRSESRAQNVSNRINDIEDVAEDLFEEWQEELGQYSDEKQRQVSEGLLRDTKTRYHALISSMRRVERRMKPVLNAFRDQVLFLKHNLNARAIASLQGELDAVEQEVATLIKEMEASIAEADAFISEMGDGG